VAINKKINSQIFPLKQKGKYKQGNVSELVMTKMECSWNYFTMIAKTRTIEFWRSLVENFHEQFIDIKWPAVFHNLYALNGTLMVIFNFYFWSTMSPVAA